MTVTLEMVLPGILGQYLDKRWGTNFLTLLGFVFGLTAGIWHLLQMTKRKELNGKRRSANSANDDET